MTTMSPLEAINKLKDGHNRFLKNSIKTLKVNLNKEKIKALKKTQNPYAVIITCSDSRILPNLIFSAGLSELFVVRTAGNTIDPLCLGSIEFALDALDVPLILVLGHEDCGAVISTINSVETGLYPPKFQIYVIDNIKPAVKSVICSNYILNPSNETLEAKCIKSNVKLTMSSLFESKIVSKKVKQKKVKIIGGVYDFNGSITFL